MAPLRSIPTLGSFLLLGGAAAMAGDILRGGAPANRPGAALEAGKITAAEAARARANAQDSLARTARAVQSVRRMQEAARAAAKGGTAIPGLPVVPEGLGPGALQPAAGAAAGNALWQGASLPVQGGNTVTVKQHAQQALLTWESFNVGAKTTLRFDQSAGGSEVGKWIALNRVLDPTGAPSQILGSIQAPGQVYVINQNGIIFGGGSQVNVHALVASSLPINDNLLERGLLNNPDSQFLFTALPQPAGANGTPAFTPPAPLTADGKIGSVIVRPGAQLTAPTNAAHVGGRIALIGANVENAGTISTPDGQTILAAGLQVGFAAHDTGDPSVRGLDAYVGAVGDYAGTATNSGLIEAQRANVTMTGRHVRQLGAIVSSTSVSLNGRIDLLADYDAAGNLADNTANVSSTGGVRNLKPHTFLPRQSGTVEMGTDSVIQLLPEWESAEKVAGTALPLRSAVNVQGLAVHMGRNALVMAPNATVAMSAGVWNFVSGDSSGQGRRTNFVRSEGQVYIDRGAMINVAGSTDVTAPLSQNIITLQLRGSELADSPLQRTGVLRAVDITIDLRRQGVYNGLAWVGTPLGNASGYLNLIERTVGELTTAGGSVSLNAGGSVVVQPGASIDVSAGWVNYEGGTVKTTRVIEGAHIIDIANATPDRVYDGIYTGIFRREHPRWGVTEEWTVPFMTGEHWEPGYLFGADAGSISMGAPAMTMDGSLLGHAITGPRQRSLTPVSGSYAASFTGQQLLLSQNFPSYSPTPPTVVVTDNPSQRAADAFAVTSDDKPLGLRQDRVNRFELGSDLANSRGFGSIRIDNPDGDIVVERGVTLKFAPRGSFTLLGANVDVRGRVTVPGGSISLSAYNISPSVAEALKLDLNAVTPAPNAGRGTVRLASGAVLSTAGLLVDDRPNADVPFGMPLVTTGGSVTVAGYTTLLERGSLIDVSGGVAMSPTGRRTYGDAGSITLRSGQDLSLPSVLGGLFLGEGTLLGYAGVGSKGGSLSLQAPLVQVGGHRLTPSSLVLTPDFFTQGGFTSFTLTGLGATTGTLDESLPAVWIAPGTRIEPKAQNVVAVSYPDGVSGLGLRPFTAPDGLRTPVSLSFRAPGVTDDFTRNPVIRGDIVLDRGALIRTDPLGSVSFSGQTVTALGSVIAPGGTISLSGASSFPTLNANPLQALPTVYIGPKARLSTAGTVVLTPDPWDRRIGKVLPGGTINVSGNIVAEAGAVLDVSGTHGWLDLHPWAVDPTPSGVIPFTSGVNDVLWQLDVERTRVDSNGGTISLRGAQMLFTDATLLGHAGGPRAIGGTLNVSSGRFYPVGELNRPDDLNLAVTQGDRTIARPFWQTGVTGIGRPVLAADGSIITGGGFFTANTFLRGGFDSLSLGGNVAFDGPVSISARGQLSVGSGGVIAANDAVRLTAPYVRLGTPFVAPFSPLDPTSPFTLSGQPYNFLPTSGPGSLTVVASHIDVGNLSLRNIGSASLTARAGDIRGNGTFNMAGALRLTAGQIYPTTGSAFTIVAYDYEENGAPRRGSITIGQSGVRSLPLSGGGTLSLYASDIVQGGTLRAPLGTIALGWDGTGTAPQDLITGQAVPVAQNVTLAAGSITSVSAVDPRTGRALMIPYGISTDGSTWIDPSGTDITAGGVPEKKVTVSALNIATEAGSVIDLSGGGELYAYRWVKGIGGSRDILASSTSFAVIPGYDSDIYPYGAYNTGPNAGLLGGDPGYVNSSLAAGDRIWLGASPGLKAGYYTLLPARYALLPGAFLVSPLSGLPLGTVTLPDGASWVSGYRFNDLDPGRGMPNVYSRWELAPQSVFRDRAEYADYFASSFLKERAEALGATVPRLPVDAGRLVLQATQGMTLLGDVLSNRAGNARGGLVDISSPVDILIAQAQAIAPAPGVLVLDSAQLSGFNAESLLIGGIRQAGANGTTVTVKTGNLTVDNAGAPLTGPEIILAATKTITLAPGASVEQSGGISGPADRLLIGSAATPGSGDGVLLRVTSDPLADVVRAGTTSSTVPQLSVGAGATISGASLMLDSTAGSAIDPTALLAGDAISLRSGRITFALDGSGTLPADAGLVLGGPVLAGLQQSSALSLLSYSSIDFSGTGTIGSPAVDRLTLSSGGLRGFLPAGGEVRLQAGTVTLDNAANAAAPTLGGTATGTLAVEAGTVVLGANTLRVGQFADIRLTASEGVLASGTGRFETSAPLTVQAPVITGGGAADHALVSGGALVLSGNGTGSVTGGLGAKLLLQGISVTAGTNVTLPSGSLTLHSTAGDVRVDGALDLRGTSRTFFDLVKYTDGGQATLISDGGNVTVSASGTIDVSAHPGAGNAGLLSVSAPTGLFALDGTALGQTSALGLGGRFELDAGRLAGGTFAPLAQTLSAGGFDRSIAIRDRLDTAITLDGMTRAQVFQFSADRGSLNVTGTIDASGVTGGRIDLKAAGSLTLAPTAQLSVAAQNFSTAGKGGAILLEAGAQRDGVIDSSAVLDLRSGASLDLSVASATPTSAFAGNLTGTLQLRAPVTAGGTSLAMAPIASGITGASSIVAEGYTLHDVTGSGAISTVIPNITPAANLLVGNTAAITDSLLATNAGLRGVFSLVPGVEIINRTGDLTLGSSSTTAAADWNLGTFRFGDSKVPGVLTLRAAGNLVFLNSLTDGFGPSASNPSGATHTWTLLDQNPLLPVNAQSWSYRLAAGSDFSAVDFHRVQPLDSLAANTGSLLLGRNGGTNAVSNPGSNAQTSAAIGSPTTTNYKFQVIRTGSGDIEIAAGRDVRLLNQFATIYTAGTKVADATMGGTFDVPRPNLVGSQLGTLGSIQQNPAYPAQYSMAGGNLTISAGHDIVHLTRNSAGELIPDSSRQLPTNWLYRRGFVNATTGEFGNSRYGEVASTTWWVDFQNFFEGVGALGGGDVTLTAGNDIQNVDAVVPTNARMPQGVPDATALVELGGGNLTVRAGRDVDGGVYYIERGRATLTAGRSVTTNATRSPSLGSLLSGGSVLDSQTWLPTTLFLGKGSFDVSARADLLLGPVANPFLTPQGYNNTYWYKTYFSTYSPQNSVTATSLSGDVTLRTAATLPVEGAVSSAAPLLQIWLERQLLLTNTNSTASSYQPWLRLAENNIAPFATALSLMPSTVRATAFEGDINLAGDLTLSPSPTGTIDFAASGAINGLSSTGIVTFGGQTTQSWAASRLNLSDASPAAIFSVTTPLAYQTIAGTAPSANRTGTDFLLGFDKLFTESGSTQGTFGVIQTKQALHAPGPLHLGDTSPVRLYAGSGDVSGLTLFAGKPARVLAGRDVSDISFYLQNNTADDVSVVSAGRDIVAYNANSPLRVLARSPGNVLNAGEENQAGDLQIGGPGTLQLLAGRDLDLGVGPNNPDGTGLGAVSIGNARNPYLPFEGAHIIAGAGLGSVGDLTQNSLDFDAFKSQYIDGPDGAKYFSELAASSPGSPASAAEFETLGEQEQRRIALQVFFLVLRDAGRSQALADGTTGGYATGFAAIDALFPQKGTGDIRLTSREFKTRSGGDISLFAPGGGLTVGLDVAGAQPLDQGVLTESGGNISIFTKDSVAVGTSRIFTLRGGNIMIWSSEGDIAAGSAAKTVASAPPTRVLIDPQSADVATDLSGLATGGGIGVLATVAGVEPGDVDLVAPVGAIDAGDAGIRSAGNLNVAANTVLNAANIAVSGSSAGTPAAPAVTAPSISSAAPPPPQPSNQGAGQQSAGDQARNAAPTQDELPSIISVQVLGYGGGDGTTDQEDEEERRRREQLDSQAPADVPETPPSQ